MSPRTTSSRLGCIAAVIDTESPSQLMPSEVHKMGTASTPEGADGPGEWPNIGRSPVLMGNILLRLLKLAKGVPPQLLACVSLSSSSPRSRVGQLSWCKVWVAPSPTSRAREAPDYPVP